MELLDPGTSPVRHFTPGPENGNEAADRPSAGYAHALYAASLREFGVPLELARAGAWALRRPIPGSPCHDAMGCYPLFACRDWNALARDLDAIPDPLVTLAVVVDPFARCDETALGRCFPDVARHFKDHFIVDLAGFDGRHIAGNHRRNARKALARLEVRACRRPLDQLDAWTGLYGVLIRRHEIRGLRAFSRESFAGQLAVPGIAAFEAAHEGRTVGMLLWYRMDDVAYYHLGAFSDEGYRLGASFALFWRAIEDFARAGLRWLDLGAGAGTEAADDGLTRFKRGWATDVRPAYFCGRIFDRARYGELARAAGCREDEPYFPAYRKGEFA